MKFRKLQNVYNKKGWLKTAKQIKKTKLFRSYVQQKNGHKSKFKAYEDSYKKLNNKEWIETYRSIDQAER